MPQYYSLDFSMGDEPYVYQFKIRDISPKGMCFLVKEDSAALKYLKVGDRINMRYYKAGAPASGDFRKTEIRHLSREDKGRFKGHYRVGISIIPEGETH